MICRRFLFQFARMKLLVVGSGGREHALVWKLAQSSQVTKIWCAPGNGGIGHERLSTNQTQVECVAIGAEDLSALVKFAEENQPDLTVIGPDNPLALGIVDLFESKKLRVWGPNQQAARFESSKAFTQEFMERHNIPTARSGIFDNPTDAQAFATALGGRCAIKADGLALGKGVLLCTEMEEAERAIEQVMVDKAFGAAGERVVIQEFLEGLEVSLHAICDGASYQLFPTSQDHKAAFDGDLGPNTGGMGAYSPAPFLSEQQLAEIKQSILDPWLNGCASENIDYRGILYPGLMITDQGPKVLEFNARFGDPETQVYLMRMENDLVELLEASLTQRLDSVPLKWSLKSAVCVVMASGGYPGAYEKGKAIHGLDQAEAHESTKIFHAGTRYENGAYLTSGGRVLGVTALGETLQDAVTASYDATRQVQFEAAQFRSDIAAKALQPS